MTERPDTKKSNVNFTLQLPFALIGVPLGWLFQTTRRWFRIGVDLADR